MRHSERGISSSGMCAYLVRVRVRVRVRVGVRVRVRVRDILHRYVRVPA